ncbi:MAG TPA: CsgG/HfaB family protein [Longimicrobiales bacterium]|nr:CsgG/HfaB family protein [Longimicrobiales bacterium]
MKTGARVPAVGLALFLSACATTLPRVAPEQIPALEQRVAADSSDIEARARLGMAYQAADRSEDARGVLASVVEAEGAPEAAHLYLGLANEALERWSDARAAYARYLEVEPRGSLADDVRGRHALMLRHELEAESRATLARERELANRPPAPRSLAVFPFRLVGGDESLEPLTAALADMMTTDLESAGALRLLERVRVQSMIREMALTEAGYAEPGTGARAGQLLGAEHVVQGVISRVGSELRLDVSVVNTPRRAATGQPVVAETQLDGLLDAEKRVVLGILDVLGVQLTAAEREAIEENRAENVLAFLAYGRGLQALDRGDFGGASAAFAEAVRLDPGFQAAQVRQSQATQLQQAAGVTMRQFTQTAAVTGGGAGTAADPTGRSAELVQQIADEIVPTPAPLLLSGGGTQQAEQQASSRDPVAESQGTEGTTRPPAATIRITIPNPTRGGGQ